jgi:hypothetical protein
VEFRPWLDAETTLGRRKSRKVILIHCWNSKVSNLFWQLFIRNFLQKVDGPSLKNSESFSSSSVEY